MVAPPPWNTHLCMDEIYSKTSRNNKYCCLLLDFETQNLIDVVINRKKYTLLNYFEQIPESDVNVNIKFTNSTNIKVTS